MEVNYVRFYIMTGFLLIDKPAGLTSHDVVDRVRRITSEKRVGHAGTLDPFATGLLIVGVGREATREFSKLVGLDKTYEATFVFGASSDTDDRTGKITPMNPVLLPTAYCLLPFLKPFIGEISQIPPAYSAIKIGGKKMYEAAREGKPLEAKSRMITIFSIELLSIPTASILPATNYLLPTTLFALRIHCSSGTYIRSLARDLGRSLGTGGYVESLRRSEIGPFSIAESLPLKTLEQSPWQEHLLSIDTVLSRL